MVRFRGRLQLLAANLRADHRHDVGARLLNVLLVAEPYAHQCLRQRQHIRIAVLIRKVGNPRVARCGLRQSLPGYAGRRELHELVNRDPDPICCQRLLIRTEDVRAGQHLAHFKCVDKGGQPVVKRPTRR